MNTRTLKNATFDTGVIIGRFQVADLHDEHKALINTVIDRCTNVIIFLGLSPLAHTRNNPLDFRSRKVMIESEYPNVDVHYIKDIPSDKYWSEHLDNLISDMVPKNHNVGLFGSRDSFIKHYLGKHTTVALEAERFISGTEQRERISREIKNSPEFRAGQIFAAYGAFPTSYQAVDAIVYDPNKDAILLGRKPNEEYYRFFGGFVDPSDDSLELAASRELHEECGVAVSTNPTYLGSFRVADWRYETERDKVMTSVFQFQYVYGAPTPGDDIAEARWFQFGQVANRLQPEHSKIWKEIEAKIVRSK